MAIDPQRKELAGASVVILMPTLNDWRSVAALLPLLHDNLAELGVSVRVVVIDDGSTVFDGQDEIKAGTYGCIEKVETLVLTRNLGNQRSIAVGIGYIATNMTADYLVVMDSDHEDPPTDIPRLLKTCASQDRPMIVFAKRSKRS